MDNERAKQILQSYRPGDQDAADPDFAEALECMRHDPELRQWFEEQQALDAAIGAKLRQAPPPSDLKERILSGHRKSQAGQVRGIWSHPLAWAALLAFMLGVASLWLTRPPPDLDRSDLARFRTDMSEFLQVFPRLDLETERLAEVKAWLASQPALDTVDLPAGLRRFPSIGCRTIQWENRSASLVCFMADGRVIHLFVLPQSQWPEADVDSAPRFAKNGPMTTALWKDQATIFLAMTPADQAFLRARL